MAFKFIVCKTNEEILLNITQTKIKITNVMDEPVVFLAQSLLKRVLNSDSATLINNVCFLTRWDCIEV